MDIKTRYENALRAFAKWLVKQGAGERVLHYAKDRYSGEKYYGVRSENKIHGEEVFTSIIKLPNGGETEILFIQEKDTGNLFAVEASYIEQEVGPIMSPYGNGEIILPD